MAGTLMYTCTQWQGWGAWLAHVRHTMELPSSKV